MISDRIENLEKYVPYMPSLSSVIRFLSENDATSLEAGRYDVSDEVYVNVQIYEPGNNEVFEAHRVYTDLQYVVEGCEEIDWIPIGDGTDAGEYVEEYDCLIYRSSEGSYAKLFLSEGSFAIFEPSDPHRPGISISGGTVRKLIFKIKV